MNGSQFVVAAALLVFPATAFGDFIAGDGFDQFIAGPSGSGPQDGTGTSVGNEPGHLLKVGSQGSPDDNTNRGRNVVYVFQLPGLGATANPFASANLSFRLDDVDASTTVNVDLYGLARREATRSILTTDYYFGNQFDTSDATLLQESILTSTSTEGSIINTNDLGDEELLMFLNDQYAAGAGAGEYVYLRLNVDGGLNNVVRGYDLFTANNPDVAGRPTITYALTAVPEASSLAFVALSGLALVCGRRWVLRHA